MAALRLGDEVVSRSGGGGASAVHLFTHRQRGGLHPFLRIVAAPVASRAAAAGAPGGGGGTPAAATAVARNRTLTLSAGPYVYTYAAAAAAGDGGGWPGLPGLVTLHVRCGLATACATRPVQRWRWCLWRPSRWRASATPTRSQGSWWWMASISAA